MALNAESLAGSMLNALPQALQAVQITTAGLIEQIRKVMPGEVRKMAVQLVEIERGHFSQPVAAQLLEMQKESFEDVLIALVDITIFKVQELINALLKIVADVVNGALGFVLL